MTDLDPWTNNPEQALAQNTPVSWKKLGLRVIGVYTLYIILTHILDPAISPSSSWPTDKVIFYYIFGYIFHFSIIFVIISLLFLASKISARFRNEHTANLLNKSLITSFVISMVLLYGGWNATKHSDKNKIKQTENYSKNKASEHAPVIAAITIQDSEGITEESLNQETLKNIETWLIQTMKQKGKNNFASSGYDPHDFDPKFHADSVYMNIDNKKLAVIKINVENAVRSIYVMGFEANEFLRVTCLRNSNHDIAVFSGECGNKIKEAFNIELKP